MGRALTHWAMALTASALLQGCGRDSDPRQNHAVHHARVVAPAASAAEADFVSAVSAAGSTGPVGLKFRVAEPPRVGQPVRVELVLEQEAGLDISHMLVSFQPGDGLAIESDRSVDFESPAVGATQRMVVNLKAQQEGLLNLNATVLVDAGNSSLTRNFSIPLIATP
jgi:hypothetical protein